MNRTNEAQVSEVSKVLGESKVVEALRSVVASVAAVACVLVRGEPGTGKSLVARALHASGPLKDKAFKSVDCASLTESDALFATTSHEGVIVLDEIGATPPSLQALLLRRLRETSPNLRWIATTERDLESEVAGGRFSDELLHHLQLVQVRVPPLRARKDDIALLAKHFAGRAAATRGKRAVPVASDALECLASYEWPGNVAELESTMDAALAACVADAITAADLPPSVRERRTSSSREREQGTNGESTLLTLDVLERQHIFQALAISRGSKTRAARMLGLDRTTLYRKLQRYADDQRTVGKCIGGDSCDVDANVEALSTPKSSRNGDGHSSQVIGLASADTLAGGCS